MFSDLRKDFPILQEKIDGNPLIYFDNAATTHKPLPVLDALYTFYTKYNANVFRGVHLFGEKATELYENARQVVAQFIGAHKDEIVFTKGTTESINFVASTWGERFVNEQDEILISELEHHANLLPWQQLAIKKKARLRYIPVDPDGTLQYEKLPELVSERTRIIAVSQTSNTLGVHNDIKTIAHYARKVGAKLLVDAAQSIPHEAVNVKELGCDFLAFSGHKILGPTGIGVLYIARGLHEEILPYQYGGGMVFRAGFEHSTWRKAPQKFEAGTPPIAQAIGLAAAIDYIMEHIDFNKLRDYEAGLCARLIEQLSTIPEVTLFGPLDQLKTRGHLVSFNVNGIHAHDLATHLSYKGICVRAGNQCAQPLTEKLGIESLVRVSFYFYNTPQEVDMFVARLKEILFNALTV